MTAKLKKDFLEINCPDELKTTYVEGRNPFEGGIVRQFFDRKTAAEAVTRFRKSLGEARLGDVGKLSLFQALGLDANDGRDAAAVMVEVARGLSWMKDQTAADKITNDLLGNSFAKLGPFMNELDQQGDLGKLMNGRRGPRPRSEGEEALRTLLIVSAFFKYRKSGNQFDKSLELASSDLIKNHGLPLSAASVKAVIDALPAEEHIVYRGKRKRLRINKL